MRTVSHALADPVGVVAGVLRRRPDRHSAGIPALVGASHLTPTVAARRRDNRPAVVFGVAQCLFDVLSGVPGSGDHSRAALRVLSAWVSETVRSDRSRRTKSWRASTGTRTVRHARLQAERRAVAAAIPPDPTAELARLDRQLTELHRNRSGLVTGQGRYAGTPEGDAARRLAVARDRYRDAQHYADTLTGWRDRRHWRKEAQRWADAESTAEAAYSRTVAPEARRIDEAISRLEDQRDELHTARRARDAWPADHPEATRRLRALDRELNPPAELPDVIRELGRTQAIGIRRDVGLQPPSHGIELDFGP